jgi:lysophospholipase L1-like esterase
MRNFKRLTCVLVVAIASLGMMASRARAAEGPFEKEIKAFETADQKQMPPKDAVLFIGSSSIRKWTTLAADFPGIAVINRGFGGSKIADSTRYADRIVFPYHPRLIVMYAGDNDIAAGNSPQKVLEDFQGFVKKVRETMPGEPIDFISIKPSLKRWKLVEKIKEANSLIEAYTKTEKGLGYIDVFPPMLGSDGKPRAELFQPDGLHMVHKGYELWTSIITPKLKATE